jgi:hypothetical protein
MSCQDKLDLNPSVPLHELHLLLGERLKVIGDERLRLHHPEAQLVELKRISEAITDFLNRYSARLDGRLRHFLQQASFQKALDMLEASAQGTEPKCRA